MYLVTNRVISKGSTIKVFGDTPNPLGPNELRIVEVNKKVNKWKVSPVKDQLSTSQVEKLAKDYHLNIDTLLP